MTDQTTRQDLEERIEHIESMLLEGRRSTQRYGWSLVLWGVAYLVAIGWSWLSNRPILAWATTMIAAACITFLISRAKARGGATSVAGRVMCALWTSIGTALMVFCFSVSLSGHYEVHSFTAAIEGFLGAANLASGIFLRWKMQLLLGILWLAAAGASCLVQWQQVGWIFIAMTVIMVGFGVYLMVLESHAANSPKRVAHV